MSLQITLRNIFSLKKFCSAILFQFEFEPHSIIGGITVCKVSDFKILIIIFEII